MKHKFLVFNNFIYFGLAMQQVVLSSPTRDQTHDPLHWKHGALTSGAPWRYAWTCFLLVLLAQSCLTLCNPMDCSLPGSSLHGDSPGKNTGMGCHSLLQGIFLTQGSNLGLLHCRRFFTVCATREAQYMKGTFKQDTRRITLVDMSIWTWIHTP